MIFVLVRTKILPITFPYLKICVAYSIYNNIYLASGWSSAATRTLLQSDKINVKASHYITCQHIRYRKVFFAVAIQWANSWYIVIMRIKHLVTKVVTKIINADLCHPNLWNTTCIYVKRSIQTNENKSIKVMHQLQ